MPSVVAGATTQFRVKIECPEREVRRVRVVQVRSLVRVRPVRRIDDRRSSPGERVGGDLHRLWSGGGVTAARRDDRGEQEDDANGA